MTRVLLEQHREKKQLYVSGTPTEFHGLATYLYLDKSEQLKKP
jgi:hypothetical protein